jgi:sulfur-oxidizing protein SoxY
MKRRTLVAGAGALVLATLATSTGLRAAEDNWSTVREMLFEGREIRDGSDRIRLEVPARALDAAMVPVGIALLPEASTAADPVRTLWLVIDNNPAPVAAIFHLTPEAGVGQLETRVRVNAYTPVHLVAETASGALVAVERFVKAAGGCSAPALKDREVAMARLGQMKFSLLDAFEPGKTLRARLKVGHPNYTGLQIDQVSRNWIPPDYVTKVDIRLDGRPLLLVDGDISLSEDPTFDFDFVAEKPGTVTAVVEDSSGRRFEGSWQIGPTS